MRFGSKSFLQRLPILGIVYSDKALAAESSGFGKITFLGNGWFREGVAIHHSTASTASCTTNPNSFAIDKNHPTYKKLVAIAVAAYASESGFKLIVAKGVCGFCRRNKYFQWIKEKS
ncbi:hypothetical protein [Xanthomonas arboricola]|uniref:hypothetical protein n=1 Tax=Xanthomonas arboricola TaxID=56448 RepID=UPI0012901FA2|nr:hypothetical protein [Xanthomonas arboricola]